MAGEKIARRLKKVKPKESELSDLLFGIVTSTSPLKIRVDNRFEVGRQHLILSPMVKDYFVSITIDKKTGTGQVFFALKTGDKVTMLRYSKGQRFYVLERSG